MKILSMLAAAALVSACASTAPGEQHASNASACGSLRAADRTMADMIDSRAVGAGATCSANPAMTPAALHERANAKTRARTSNGRF